MDLHVEISEVIFVGNSTDARYTRIHKGQPDHVLELCRSELGRRAVRP